LLGEGSILTARDGLNVLKIEASKLCVNLEDWVKPLISMN
jgi:hypothetical protein